MTAANLLGGNSDALPFSYETQQHPSNTDLAATEKAMSTFWLVAKVSATHVNILVG
jgi:hypothetical protein